jgi:hypothetical protein
MIEVAEIEQSIESLLKAPLYGQSPEQKSACLLPLLQKELAYACDQNQRLRNYVEHWPVDFRVAESIADLPFLPVGIFKANPPFALVEPQTIVRTLASSSTSSQIPSRIALDRATARRMTRSLAAIIRDFAGAERRPYLVVDTPENLAPQSELGARGAAVQGLTSFATEIATCLVQDENNEPRLDIESLLALSAKWKDRKVLVYGFTYVIWNHLVLPLQRAGKALALPNALVLHSGGWKRLEHQSVTKDVFSLGVASVLGCASTRVIDYYGMVENVGVVYPDCEFGNKHVPAFADVIVRDPLTLAPVEAGRKGLLQICSVLPTSFPGFLVLTDDIAEVVGLDGCPCGRRGISFRFAGRVAKAEMRGCGNLEPTRHGLARAEQHA